MALSQSRSGKDVVRNRYCLGIKITSQNSTHIEQFLAGLRFEKSEKLDELLIDHNLSV